MQPKTSIESQLQEKYKQTQLKKVSLNLKISCANGITIDFASTLKL
jgi:hypothetical protein